MATDSTSSTQPAYAHLHFSNNFDEADIVLRSKEGVNLSAQRTMLRRVSPVFATSLENIAGSAPLLYLSINSDARTIDALLHYLYPDLTPKDLQLDELLALLDLAIKYEVRCVTPRLRHELVKSKFLEMDPIRIYVAASHWNLLKEAEVAAEATGSVELRTVSYDKLQGVSAIDYVRLVARHRRRKEELTKALDMWFSRRCGPCHRAKAWAHQYHRRAIAALEKNPDVDWILSERFMRASAKTSCNTCDNRFMFKDHWDELKRLAAPSELPYRTNAAMTSMPSEDVPPLSEHDTLFQQGDCTLKSVDGRELHVYRGIVAEASSFWSDIFNLPSADGQMQDQRPVVECAETGVTLYRLLQLIYPIIKPDFGSFAEIEAVLEAAHKFDIAVAVQHISLVLQGTGFLRKDPVRVYALACRYELKDLLRVASVAALYRDLDLTTERSVVGLPAVSFMQLIHFRNARATQITRMITASHTGLYCSVCGPRWVMDWSNLATIEIQRMPVADTIFSIPFVARCFPTDKLEGFPSKDGSVCHCLRTFTEADRDWLAGLKLRIEQLPQGMGV